MKEKSYLAQDAKEIWDSLGGIVGFLIIGAIVLLLSFIVVSSHQETVERKAVEQDMKAGKITADEATVILDKYKHKNYNYVPIFIRH